MRQQPHQQVISPTLDEYGVLLDSNGLYYINTRDKDINIKKSRIHGTLVIEVDTKTVTV